VKLAPGRPAPLRAGAPNIDARICMMTGRRVRAHARVVILPAAPDPGLLLVRTDYSDDLAWYVALSAATAVYDTDDFERVGALLLPVESLPCRASGPPAGSTFTPGLPQPDRGSGRADDA
jgi:hypothetical protein